MASPFSLAADLLDIDRRLDDPVDWISTTLDEHLWSIQRDIARSVRDHRETVVHSCHGSGKSFLAARIVAWWISSHPPGSAFAVTSAPTFPQVRAILWRELNRAHRKARLRGRTNQTEWFIGDEMVAFGRKPSDYDETAFQGIHAEHVLVVLDEAAGIPADLWDAAGNLATTEGSRILAIGNPDDPTSEFARRCDPANRRDGRNVIKVSVFDTPNFTGEQVPEFVARQLVSRTWHEEKLADWGEDDPRYVAKVLGEFPADDEHGVVPFSAVQACRRPDQPDTDDPIEIGVDVGAGGDETVIVLRAGRRAVKVDGFRSDDATKTAQRILKAIVEHQPSRVKVDSIGIGWGVVGRLREYRTDGAHQATVIGVNVGAKSTDPERFPKLRDQLWWEVGRQLTTDKAWDLSELSDDVIRQLTAVRWSPDAAGRVKIESKDETKKRIGRSPDDADALLLAFHQPPLVAVSQIEEAPNGRDPYEAERRSAVWG